VDALGKIERMKKAFIAWIGMVFVAIAYPLLAIAEIISDSDEA